MSVGDQIEFEDVAVGDLIGFEYNGLKVSGRVAYFTEMTAHTKEGGIIVRAWKPESTITLLERPHPGNSPEENKEKHG